jgi:hypothetical protein
VGSFKVGQPVTFQAAAAADPVAAVQWQESTDGGTTWAAIPEATSPTYTFTPTSSRGFNGTLYQAVFTNTQGTTAAPADFLGTAPIKGLVSPKSLTGTVGKSITFKAGDKSPGLTVQWQVSTDQGQTWTDIADATGTGYTFVPSAADNASEYRALLTNGPNQVSTAAAVLLLHGVPPQVTAQPGSQAVSAGAVVTFLAAAGGSTPLTVQWEVSTDGGQTFKPLTQTLVPGFGVATSRNPLTGALSTVLFFTTSSDGSQNGYEFQALFTNAAGKAFTNKVLLTVTIGPP